MKTRFFIFNFKNLHSKNNVLWTQINKFNFIHHGKTFSHYWAYSTVRWGGNWPREAENFNSKIKVWDFGKISSSEFQCLSFNDKSCLLKKHHVEMLAKYTVGKGKLFFCSCLAIFWLCFDCKVWLCLAFLWLCFE